MTAVLKACGVIIIGLFAALLFRENAKTARFGAVVCAFLAVMLFFMGGGLSDAVRTVFSDAGYYFPESAKIMLKSMGIAYITAITGEICTSAGEETLASAAAFAGKVEITVLCLPLLTSLIKLAGENL